MLFSPEAVFFDKKNKRNEGESCNFVIPSRITWMDNNLPFRRFPGGTPCNGPYGEAPPQRGTFFQASGG